MNEPRTRSQHRRAEQVERRFNECTDAMGGLAIATIGEELFDAIARKGGEANAVRAAEVRMYAEQHQERARWNNAKSK